MKHQSCTIVARLGKQPVHDLGMNRRLSVRRDDGLDCDSRYLVAESNVISVLDQQIMC